MKKNWQIFLLFSKFSIKGTSQNRLGVMLLLFGKIVRFTTFFLFLFILVARTKFLGGYTLNQTMVFYLTYNLIDNLGQLLYREVYRFRPLIVSGELDTILVKPYHPFLRILVGGIDLMDLVLVFPYIFLLAFFIAQTHFTFIFLILYIGLIVNALILATSFHIVVLALGILTTEVDHTVMIYRDITRLGFLPIDIYKEPIRSLLTFVVPIGIMMTVPVKTLFGLVTIPTILLSFAFSFFIAYISLFIWDKALKKYQSWGG